MTTTIRENIEHVQAEIAAACARANREPSQVKLIAVSKTQSNAAMNEAIDVGLQHFGENRVEEAGIKIATINAPVTWHMIGHIQSRKVKDVVPLFQMVHSVDSLGLAEKLARTAVIYGNPLNVLIQVNVSGEVTKSGLQAVNWQQDSVVRDQLWQDMRHILAQPGLKSCGLMTMAPIVDDMQQARPIFAELAALRQALSESLDVELAELSMGMTDDYPVAIEEGATMVRIGRAIFGERNP